jgi:hypothetical protein
MGEDHAWRAAEIVPQFISEVEVDLLLQAAPLIQARRALLEVIYAGAFAFLKPWP